MKKTKLERASFCVECGPNVRVDEAGCCAACGASAMGPWADKVVAALKAQTPSAVQRAEQALVRAAMGWSRSPNTAHEAMVLMAKLDALREATVSADQVKPGDKVYWRLTPGWEVLRVHSEWAEIFDATGEGSRVLCVRLKELEVKL